MRFALPIIAAFALACADDTRNPTAPVNDVSLDVSRSHANDPSGPLVYALTSDGSLITFSAEKANQTRSAVRVTGLQPLDELVGIDFRASDLNADGVNNIGVLYGMARQGSAVGRIYTIDPTTGVATFRVNLTTAAGAPVGLSGTSFGVGFNPVVDRLRVHSDAEQNLRINVDNGVTIVDPNLAFFGTDVNAGANPNVSGTAYTNSDADATTPTELYAIDAARDVLVEFSTPGGANSGQLVTVGTLGVDTDLAIGFDIVGSAAGTAYATLSTANSGKSVFYTIDLDTGRATRLKQLAQTKSEIISIALKP